MHLLLTSDDEDDVDRIKNVSNTLSNKDKKEIFNKNKEKLEKLVEECIKTIKKSTLAFSDKPYHAVNLLEEIYDNTGILSAYKFPMLDKADEILEFMKKKSNLFSYSYKLEASIENLKKREDLKFDL